MKKAKHLSLIAVMLGFLLAIPVHVFAGGGSASVLQLTSSASSATVGHSVTVSVYAYQYACHDGVTLGINTHPFTCSDGSQSFINPTNGYFWISITGSNNTTSGLASDGGHDAVITGADGKAQFTLSSTTAEAKSITVTHTNGFYTDQNKTITVTFKKVAAPAPAPVVVVPAPDPPKVSVEVQGKATQEATIALRNKQPLVLKGTTVANATVKLYIFSEPRQETVVADGSGNWTYAVSGLEPGQHHVEAEVTDPKTGKTSTRATLVAFTVAQPPKISPAKKVTGSSPAGAWLVLAAEAIAVAAAGGGAWWWLMRRNKPAVPASPVDMPDPDKES